MLYERWRKTAAELADEPALIDLGNGQRWSFRQLAQEAEQATTIDSRVEYPQGHGAGFVVSVLRAWRDAHILCPLEADHAAPKLTGPFPKDCVHLKSTSGSTGNARLVAFTAGQLAADAGNIVATMGLRRDWPNLGAISLAHSYGFSNLVLPLLLHGIPLILVPSTLPEAVREAARAHPHLTLPAVPALWRAWHEADAIPANVRLAISAGAPLPLQLEESIFAERGLKIHNFLGASECGGIAYDRSQEPRKNPACVGTAMHGIALSVNDSGCLEVRSEAVAETYWPEADERLAGGRFQTSDLAELWDGEVLLNGRASDLINVAGRKLPPELIEQALLKHPTVKECLVLGLPDNHGGRSEVIAAVVAVREPVTGDALRQFPLAALPAWQVPREWTFVDALAPNTRGKMSRAEWRQRLA